MSAGFWGGMFTETAQQLSLTYDGTFSGDSSGVNDIASIGAAGAWTDMATNIWSTVSGQLVGTTDAGAGYATQLLRRPDNEAVVDQQISVYVPTTYGTGNARLGILLRIQPNGSTDHYLGHQAGGDFYIYRFVSGNLTQLYVPNWGSFSVNNEYIFKMRATNSSGDVLLQLFVTDITNDIEYGPFSYTDSAPTKILGAGVCGLSTWASGTVAVNRVITEPYEA